MPGAETFRTSAAGYDRHIGRYSPALAAELIRVARIGPGMRALDVGCGPGALTTALAEQLGAANVSAADPSEPFAAACRARLPGVEAVVAGAESLPFGDESFDAALSQLVVNFMRDAEAGVREMARVTRPGGTIASCVWDYAGSLDDEGRAALHDAYRRLLEVGDEPFGLTARAWAVAGSRGENAP